MTAPTDHPDIDDASASPTPDPATALDPLDGSTPPGTVDDTDTEAAGAEGIEADTGDTGDTGGHSTWRRGWARFRPHAIPFGLIGLSVVLANLPAILGLVTSNPIVLDGGLTPGHAGVLPGYPYLDPNAGFTLQALGHLSATDWLHGHVPWWNPFEGVGSPLAGEMQSGALFPLTLLLAFRDGVLLLMISLELLAGWSTYALVRRIGVGRTLATAAGVAFGLCGTFAWFAHAPVRPVAFLPMALLGVERALSAASEQRRGGWRLLAVAIGLSILAGFPETTVIDGLFVIGWAGLRLIGPERVHWRSYLAKVVGGGAAGVALAAPLLVAFDSYLPFADVGSHSGNGLAFAALPAAGISQVVLPYVFGPIFGFHAPAGAYDPISVIWGNVGGYLGVTLIATALVGLVGRRLRPLRLGIGAWVALCLLRTYGYPPVLHLMSHLPGIRSTAFYRYSNPSWEMAVVVLAALGMDDIARTLTRRWVLATGVVITAGLAGWAAVTAWPLLTDTVSQSPGVGPKPHAYVVGSLVAGGLFLTALLIGGVWAGRRQGRRTGVQRSERIRRRGRVVMAGVVGLEAIALLGFTYLSAPPAPVTLQTGAVTWLQSHLGTYRFYTLGPIQPDYGAYFRIAQVNLNDSPWPKSMNAEILANLDPNTIPGSFTGGARLSVTGPTPAEELTRHLRNFESLGVRYVVEGSSGTDVQGHPFPAIGTPAWPAGPRLVYRDGFAEIWQLPTAAPAFSLQSVATGTASGGSTGAVTGPAPGCTVVAQGWDQATVRCRRPSVLLRRVQYMPGWTATVNGSAVRVEHATSGPAGLFQQIPVPAGTSTVTFTFSPPHATAAFAVSLVAAALIVGSLLRNRRRRSGPPIVEPIPVTGDPPTDFFDSGADRVPVATPD